LDARPAIKYHSSALAASSAIKHSRVPCCSFRSLSVLSETWRRRFARSLAGALHPLTGTDTGTDTGTGTGTRALEPASQLGFLAATRATQGLQELQGLQGLQGLLYKGCIFVFVPVSSTMIFDRLCPLLMLVRIDHVASGLCEFCHHRPRVLSSPKVHFHHHS
jgi:hypothetical protein